MTLLDHSRAQERDAVAKARPTTDSDTVVVRAPAGSLGVFIARGTSHRVTEVRSGSPLAGEVAVGDRLVSISTPGRALFTCGPTATGLDIVDELRAGAGSDGRVLTFARRGQAFFASFFRKRVSTLLRGASSRYPLAFSSWHSFVSSWAVTLAVSCLFLRPLF
jgi:hypothetical protein